ncbi:hypothetical protein [Cupriavidus taiwanensis]|uniref:hypothetical protein n=1 Tax=Cupriavidus taiwanensis TaxID=164546 RepID=UPI0011C04C60|nr:hypothetical protein [Cupriavidus taiwanensis]
MLLATLIAGSAAAQYGPPALVYSYTADSCSVFLRPGHGPSSISKEGKPQVVLYETCEQWESAGPRMSVRGDFLSQIMTLTLDCAKQTYSAVSHQRFLRQFWFGQPIAEKPITYEYLQFPAKAANPELLQVLTNACDPRLRGVPTT